ncbi:reticulophagy [Homalodisca vitripennis]|nr:reticulophagy [Homalodisca vitripennis]
MADLDFRDSCKEAFKTLGIPTVITLYITEVILHAYTQRPERNGDIHDYNTRRANDFSLPLHHSALFAKKPSYAGAKLYNMLPKNFKTSTPQVLKKRLIKWLVGRSIYSVEEFKNITNWAKEISSQLHSIHSDEVDKRENFLTLFEGHILKDLFPGLEDVPSPFATQAPETFDTKLPKYRRMRLKSCKYCQGLSVLDWCKSMSTPWQRKGNAGRATPLLRYRTLKSR